MAGNALALTWDLIANDAASPVFARVSAAADKTAASTEAAAAKTGASLSTMAKVAAVAGVAFVAEAVKMGAEFQKQMLLIQTQAGASAQEVRNMTPAILSLSGKVAQAPEALATSLYHVESTGLRGKAALEAVKIAAEGAAVGHADLEQTTNALTATIASGMLPATESYSQAMGQLNTIVGSGDMKLSDLNEALATGVLVTTKQYGVTLNDVGAALADFGDNNIRGADAATSLRMAVQAIAKPGVDAESALGRVGLTVQQLQSDEQTGGLNKALTDLHTHLVNSGIDSTQWGALMTDAFTKKAGGGIITLIGTFDRFQQKYKEVSAGSASFAQEFAATTHTAAFQAAALKDNIESMTTSIGTHLLPVATNTLTWINSTGVPALEHLGSGAMGVAHFFGELPTPIRDTGLALAGLGLANAIGLTGVLSSAAARVGTAFTGAATLVRGFGDEMAVQARLAQMDAAAIGEMDAALGGLGGGLTTAAGELTNVQLMMAGWDGQLAATAAEEDAASAATGRFSAALGTMSARAGAALGAGSGTLGFGPVALAIGGSLFAIKELNDAFVHDYDPSAKIATADAQALTTAQQSFTAALQASNGAIDSNVRSSAAKALQDANVLDVAQRAKIDLSQVTDAVLGNKAAYDSVRQSLQLYYDGALIATSDGTKAHEAEAQKAKDALDAFEKLAGQLPKTAAAQKQLSDAVNDVNTSLGGTGGASGAAVKGLEYAASAAGMSKDQIDAANKSWEAWIKTLSGLDAAFADPLSIYEDLLSQKQAAEQKSAQATADATKSGKDSWQDYAKNVTVSLGEYAKQLETQLTNEQNWKDNLVKIAQRGGVEVAQQFADMGVKGADLTAQMATATDGNFTRMATDMANEAAAGGTQAAQNLDQAMRVMAEIGKEGGAATAANVAAALGVGVDQVAAIAKQYGVALAAGINPVLSGLGKPTIDAFGTLRPQGFIGPVQPFIGPHAANGGVLPGYAPGVDSVHALLSPGEGVIVPEAVRGLGGAGAIHAINAAFSSRVQHFAGGGFVSPSDVPRPYSTAPFQWPISTPADAAMSTEYDNVTSWLAANANNPYLGAVAGATSQAAVQLGARMAAAIGWTGVQWDSLFNLWMRESGWNPYAVNPSSGAYGIPQSLGHGHPYNLGDSAAQIAWGENYIQGRYDTPAAAWAHEMAAGWYHNGGVVPGPPGANVPAVLQAGETVRTAKQEAALGSGKTYVNHFHVGSGDAHVIASAVTREQRIQDFLHA